MAWRGLDVDSVGATTAGSEQVQMSTFCQEISILVILFMFFSI